MNSSRDNILAIVLGLIVSILVCGSLFAPVQTETHTFNQTEVVQFNAGSNTVLLSSGETIHISRSLGWDFVHKRIEPNQTLTANYHINIFGVCFHVG